MMQETKGIRTVWVFLSLLHTLCWPKQISFSLSFTVCGHQFLCASRVVFQHICHNHQVPKESHAWQPEIPMIQVLSYRFRCFFLLFGFTCVCYLSQFNCLVCCHQGLLSLCHISSRESISWSFPSNNPIFGSSNNKKINFSANCFDHIVLIFPNRKWERFL